MTLMSIYKRQARQYPNQNLTNLHDTQPPRNMLRPIFELSNNSCTKLQRSFEGLQHLARSLSYLRDGRMGGPLS
jgi:hypothetical protein